MLVVIIFCYVPLFGWSYAFFNYRPGVPLSATSFVGLKHFQMIFSNTSDFWQVMRNTLVIYGLNLCFSVVPVIFAIMISHVRSKGYARVIQTLSSIPNFISWVLVYSIIFYILGAENSALNRILLGVGLIDRPVSLLTNPRIAWIVQALISVWKNAGYGAIIYLAAISGIDQELYEAAEVDGANGFQKDIHITLPGVAPTYLVMLILSIASMLSSAGFEHYWLFGNGMTWDVLEVFDTYVYRVGIQNMQFSFSTALGIFKSVVSIVLLTFANSLSRLFRETSMF
jgi:ABC-type polysaccharide transport system permease subunit